MLSACPHATPKGEVAQSQTGEILGRSFFCYFYEKPPDSLECGGIGRVGCRLADERSAACPKGSHYDERPKIVEGRDLLRGLERRDVEHGRDDR